MTGQNDNLDDIAYFHALDGRDNVRLDIFSDDRDCLKEIARDSRTQHVEVLIIKGENIRPRDLDVFTNCPSLNRIVVCCPSIDCEDINALAKFPKLETFKISRKLKYQESGTPRYAKISSDAYDSLLGLRLKGLWLECPLTDSMANAFARCDSLEDLTINCAENNASICSSLRVPANLKKLQLFATNLSPDSLSALNNHDKLTQVALDTDRWQGEPWNEIAKIPNLESVVISGRELTGKGIQCLSTLNNLRYLRIETPTFSEQAAKELLKCRQLTTISVMDAPVSDDLALEFLEMPNLTTLYFGLGQISKKSADKISTVMELRRLEEN